MQRVGSKVSEGQCGVTHENLTWKQKEPFSWSGVTPRGKHHGLILQTSEQGTNTDTSDLTPASWLRQVWVAAEGDRRMVFMPQACCHKRRQLWHHEGREKHTRLPGVGGRDQFSANSRGLLFLFLLLFLCELTLSSKSFDAPVLSDHFLHCD